MWKLALILFIIIGPTMTGIAALVPLTMYGVNDFNALMLIAFAAGGTVLSIPVSYFVATRVGKLMKSSSA